MYWGEKTTETTTNYVHKDTSWFLLLVSAYQNKVESGSPAVDLFLTTANFFLSRFHHPNQ